MKNNFAWFKPLPNIFSWFMFTKQIMTISLIVHSLLNFVSAWPLSLKEHEGACQETDTAWGKAECCIHPRHSHFNPTGDLYIIIYTLIPLYGGVAARSADYSI